MSVEITNPTDVPNIDESQLSSEYNFLVVDRTTPNINFNALSRDELLDFIQNNITGIGPLVQYIIVKNILTVPYRAVQDGTITVQGFGVNSISLDGGGTSLVVTTGQRVLITYSYIADLDGTLIVSYS